MKIIATLGPATRSESALRAIKDKGVDFVRVNMSHSTLDDLRYCIGLAKKAGIPFLLDTEGSQVRTGILRASQAYFREGSIVRITAREVAGDASQISIRPPSIVPQLEEGDMLYLDFDSLVLCIRDARSRGKGFVTARVVAGGYLGSNKGVAIESAFRKTYNMPVLSPKDEKAVAIGLEEEVGCIAASFMRRGESVQAVRRATKWKMKIISKVECVDALLNLDGIIRTSDFLLVDRGDLSKEIAVPQVPLVQKMVISRARQAGKGVYIATNLLETMVKKRKPTRAEVHDIEQTILDGAYGLVLAAETAVGKHPMECINMLVRIIEHMRASGLSAPGASVPPAVKKLIRSGYCEGRGANDSLAGPHGGDLVSRFVEAPGGRALRRLPRLHVSDQQYMEAEQIALGTMSPLRGFMGEKDVLSVLNSLRLKSGVPWPLPVVLDVSRKEAERIPRQGEIVLCDENGEPFGTMNVMEKYIVDKPEYAFKLYDTLDDAHPGVGMVRAAGDVFLAGEVLVFRRRPSSFKCYELAPLQVRRLFEERGWRKVVGFHTRNVIHRGHEFIQREALRRAHADGLFVHPVVGRKKTGDFNEEPIIRSYEIMVERFFPRNKVAFATFPAFSRYAGPREALFTALCRKNFGCSHFVVGRDHTGVAGFYPPGASHEIFERFPDLGIEPIFFDEVVYVRRARRYVEQNTAAAPRAAGEVFCMSGTEARKKILSKKQPPRWLMRPEISAAVLSLQKRGRKVFV